MKNKQLKITMEAETVKAFKSACTINGVTMTAELSNFIKERINVLNKSYTANSNCIKTKGGRRKEIAKCINLLIKIRDAENEYKKNIPTNLVSGPAYEASEQAIELLDEAVSILSEAF